MRMKSPEIYVTIGPWCTDQLPDTIESLLEKGIHCFVLIWPSMEKEIK